MTLERRLERLEEWDLDDRARRIAEHLGVELMVSQRALRDARRYRQLADESYRQYIERLAAEHGLEPDELEREAQELANDPMLRELLG